MSLFSLPFRLICFSLSLLVPAQVRGGTIDRLQVSADTSYSDPVTVAFYILLGSIARLRLAQSRLRKPKAPIINPRSLLVPAQVVRRSTAGKISQLQPFMLAFVGFVACSSPSLALNVAYASQAPLYIPVLFVILPQSCTHPPPAYSLRVSYRSRAPIARH